MISTMKNLARTGLLLGAIAFGLAACGPEYDHTDITLAQKSSGLDGEFTSQRIVVTEGAIVTARIVPWNHDKDPLALTLRPKASGVTAETIIDIRPTVNDRTYAFFGVKEGQTEIEFVVDGTVVLTIPAIVTRQPAP